MNTSIIRIETRRIQNKLVDMTKLVIDQHANIAKALKKNDRHQALEILGDDRIINAKFDEITAELEFLITKTPLDKDLRRTMAYIMIAQDLERIGDYVKYIATLVVQSPELDHPITNRILTIHTPFMKMLKKLILVIDEEKYEEALKLAESDRPLDKLTNKLRTDIISSIASKKSEEEIASRVFAINVIAGIERAADHITHICELIAYIKTGKHVDLE